MADASMPTIDAMQRSGVQHTWGCSSIKWRMVIKYQVGVSSVRAQDRLCLGGDNTHPATTPGRCCLALLPCPRGLCCARPHSAAWQPAHSIRNRECALRPACPALQRGGRARPSTNRLAHPSSLLPCQDYVSLFLTIGFIIGLIIATNDQSTYQRPFLIYDATISFYYKLRDGPAGWVALH